MQKKYDLDSLVAKAEKRLEWFIDSLARDHSDAISIQFREAEYRLGLRYHLQQLGNGRYMVIVPTDTVRITIHAGAGGGGNVGRNNQLEIL